MIGNIYPSFPMRDCTYTDAVICVDAGAGMRGEMDGIKAEILAFPARYATEVDDNTLSPLEQFRVKLIVFGEGNAEGLMRESEVFSLPEQCGEFKAFVNGIEAGVTNSTAADALNAVLRARMFDWTDTFKAGVRGRQIIMLFTNSGMHSADGSAGLLWNWWGALRPPPPGRRRAPKPVPAPPCAMCGRVCGFLPDNR